MNNHCHSCGRALPLAWMHCRLCAEPVCEHCDVPSQRDEETGSTVALHCAMSANLPLGYSLPKAFRQVIPLLDQTKVRIRS